MAAHTYRHKKKHPDVLICSGCANLAVQLTNTVFFLTSLYLAMALLSSRTYTSSPRRNGYSSASEVFFWRAWRSFRNVGCTWDVLVLQAVAMEQSSDHTTLFLARLVPSASRSLSAAASLSSANHFAMCHISFCMLTTSAAPLVSVQLSTVLQALHLAATKYRSFRHQHTRKNDPCCFFSFFWFAFPLVYFAGANLPISALLRSPAILVAVLSGTENVCHVSSSNFTSWKQLSMCCGRVPHASAILSASLHVCPSCWACHPSPLGASRNPRRSRFP